MLYARLLSYVKEKSDSSDVFKLDNDIDNARKY